MGRTSWRLPDTSCPGGGYRFGSLSAAITLALALASSGCIEVLVLPAAPFMRNDYAARPIRFEGITDTLAGDATIVTLNQPIEKADPAINSFLAQHGFGYNILRVERDGITCAVNSGEYRQGAHIANAGVYVENSTDTPIRILLTNFQMATSNAQENLSMRSKTIVLNQPGREPSAIETRTTGSYFSADRTHELESITIAPRDCGIVFGTFDRGVRRTDRETVTFYIEAGNAGKVYGYRFSFGLVEMPIM